MRPRPVCSSLTLTSPVGEQGLSNHPQWSVLTVQKEHGKGAIVDLFLEDDMTKLDSRWLANVLGVRRSIEYWTKVSQGEIVA